MVIKTEKMLPQGMALLALLFVFLLSSRPLQAQHDGTERTRQMLESILKSAPTGIGVVEHRVIVQVNDYILDLTGYTREELLGKSARMLYPSQAESDFVGAEKYRQISEKGTGSVETRWLRKDGSIRHVLLSSTPLDSQDLALGVTFTVLDISERKQAEALLKESEDRFSRLFHDHAAVMLLLDAESGKILDANQSAETFYGWSRELLMGKAISELNILSPAEIQLEMVRAKTQQRNYFEFKHTKADGSICDVAVHSSGIQLQGKTILHSIILDISEEKARERREKILWIALAAAVVLFVSLMVVLHFRLAASLKRQQAISIELENFFSVNLDLLCIADTEGHFLKTNAAWTDLLGYGTAELEARKFLDFIHPDDLPATLAAMQNLGKGEEVLGFINRYRCKDGSYRFIEWRSRPAGKVIYAAARDISGRILAEEEIKKQLLEKEMLLREVHHRVKNNITIIEGLLNIQASSADNADCKASLEDAASRVRSMGKLYEQMLSSEAYGQISVKAYIEELIAAIFEIFPEQAAVRIHLDIDDFMLDSKKAVSVGIIVNELVTNAFKYAFVGRAGGNLDIRLEHSGAKATLTVQDDGVGFPAGTAPGKTAAAGFSGLGCNLVKMLAEQLKGAYLVEQAQGTKSTVEFII